MAIRLRRPQRGARLKPPKRIFGFKPFSKQQLKLMTWWMPGSPFQSADGVIAEGAIRSGKTVAMIVGFLFWSLLTFGTKEGQDFIIAGKSMGALKRNVLKPLFQILNALGIKYFYNRSSEAPNIQIWHNTYYLFAGHDERSQDVLQGFTAAGLLIDEVVLIPKSFVEQAIGRCSVEGSKLWYTCNPGGPFHWFKTEFVDERKKKRLLRLHFTLDDNPALSGKIKNRYKRMYPAGSVWYKRFILGQWAIAEGLVFDMFNEDVHVLPLSEIPTWFPRYGVSIDHGTTNATVFGFFGYGRGDGRVYLLNLFYYDPTQHLQGRKTDSQLANDFEKWLSGKKPQDIVCDPAAATFIVELENRGYEITKADNAVLDGIRLLSNQMHWDDAKQPSFFLADRAEMLPLKQEFGSYGWDEKAQERGEDKPTKGNDHGLDMVRYFFKTVIWPFIQETGGIEGWEIH